MRFLIFFFLLFLVAVPAWCQPDLSEPPELIPLDDSVEPRIAIRQGENETIEEYRLNGRRYKIRVTPLRGESYLLIDHRGDGSFVPGTKEMGVPQWVTGTF